MLKHLLSICILFFSTLFTANSQIVSNNAFLQGKYVEVGVSQCGSFGSSVCAPSGYHARGTGSNSQTCQLGFIANPAKDNWTNYVGDYFLPGTPEEGWGISANGTNYNNNLICATNNISGSIINYTSNATQSSATWQGSVGGLSITSRTYIPVNSVYFITEVTVVNTSASTINNVYYMRNVDPDHGVLTPGAGGSYNTNNSIVYQTPNTCSQALVSATTLVGNYYLGLGSIDSRARVAMGSFANRSAVDIWNAPAVASSGLVSSGSRTSVDEAICISFNLGNLAPNQSTKFAYTYILDANQLSEALAATNINLSINNVSYASGSSVDICSNSPVPVTITNPGGFTSWSWSPSSGLNTTTGTSVIATLTGPITYTASGSGACGSVNVDISLNPQILTPPGNATTITAPSVLTFGQTGVVLSVPPVTNATSYYWELPPGTVVTSPSSTTNTITISVSNTSWCGKIKVYPINACATGGPAIKDICITNIFTGNVRTNICAGDTLSVPFTLQAGSNFLIGNTFTAQLSDTSGSFDNPVNMGSITSTSAGTIVATIPTSTFKGNLYRVRVVSSIPNVLGADNGSDITINVTRPSINVNGTKRVLCVGSGETFTATISGGGTSPSYQWKKNGVNVGSNSNVYTDNSLVNGDIITCVLTSNALCASPAILTSNSYYVNVSPTPTAVLTSSGCSGGTLTLTSNSVISKIQLYKNGTLSSTATSSFATTATTKAGGNGFGSAANQLASPSGVFVDDNGNVYVADRYNHRVQKFTSSSTVGVTVAGGAGSGSAANQLNTPTSVFVDKSGNIYVAESGNNRVTKWAVGATTGIVVAGGNGNGNAANQLNGPHTVFVDNGQNIYVSDQYNNRVQRWDAGATTGVTVAGGNNSGAAANQLNLPQGICLDNNNNLFIADQGNNRIQKWNKGAVTGTTVAGGNGSGSAANQLSFPVGVFVDANNNVYITDYFNARVQKWIVGFASGITVAGGNGAGTAANQLSGPIGITVGKDGAMYVVEDFNNRVQKFSHTITSTLNNIQPGTYYVTVTNANNCTATSTPITIYKSRTPTITINASQSTLCSSTPTTVNFTSIVTNAGTTPIYQWKKNGVVVGTNSPTYSDNALLNGDSVVCYLTSNDTCVTAATVASNKIDITVNNAVVPGISITAVQSVLCSGNTFDFTATPVNGGNTPSYQWQVNGSNVGTNSANFSSNSLVNGDVVKCILTSGAVCNTGLANSNLITVSITPTITPTISIAASQNNICTGTSVTLTATATSAGSVPAYQWKINGINVATGSAFTTNSLQNNDTVTCELTSNLICNSGVVTSNKIVMVVNSNIVPQIAITTPSASICDGSTVVFTASTINGGTNPVFQWKKNGLDVGTNDTSYTDNSLVDGDAISCLITSNANCLSFANAVSNLIVVTVNPNLVSTLSISSNQTNICSGTSVTFTANATNAGTTPIYQWKKNGINVGSNNSVYTTTSLANNDTIKCLLTSSATCVSPTNLVSNNIIVAVTPTVTPTIAITTSTTTICSGSSVTFTASIINGGLTPSYQWYVNDIPVGTDSSRYTTASLISGSIVKCVLLSNASCASVSSVTSNLITITVNPTVTPLINISTSSTTLCSATTSVTFFSSISGGGVTPTYQWRKNGVIVGTGSSYTGASWTNGDSVTCTLISNAICRTAPTAISNTIYITVVTPVTPTINITTPSTNVCGGLPITFTANVANAGSSPQYYWRINGSTVAITSTNTYITSSLVSGNIVSCQLSSSATCATPANVVSNNITMTVTASVTPSIVISTTQTSICSGTSLVFNATASGTGTTPIYQWQKNGINVGSNATTYTDNSLANNDIVSCILTSNANCATVTTVSSNNLSITVTTVNSPLVVTPINITCGQTALLSSIAGVNDSVRWFNSSSGGSSFATAFTTAVTPTTTTTYYAESFNAPVGGSPRVTSIATSGATVIDHNTITGDDRGGIALSSNYVYIVGDNATGRFNRTDLSGGSSLTLRDGFFGDLSNGNLWQFGNTTSAGASFSGGAINVLYRLDESLNLTGTSLNLSQSINTGSGNIVAAGFGFLLYHNGTNTYHINLNSGAVTTLPYVGSISAVGSESWASYGWGEYDGVDYNICYVAFSSQIVKQNLRTGTVSVIQTFTNLSDMAACVFDATNNRLYFHHENSSQFGGLSETLGFVSTTKITPSASCTSARVPVVVNVSYNTPTVAINASQTTICSGNNVVFTATTTFEGSAPVYQWQVNGSNVGTNSSSYSSNTLLNGDVVTCRLTSNATCLTSNIANSNSLTINVAAIVVPSVSITANQLPVCAGASTTFTAKAVNGGTAPVYEWRKNGVVVGGNSSTYSTNVLSAGNTITCTITSNALCVTSNTATSNTITITIATPIIAGVNITASASAICPGSVLSYTATPTNGGTSPIYQWQVNGANVGINASNYSSSILQDGDIVACIMTSNSTGCLAESTVSSNVLPVSVYSASIIKTIAGNGSAGFSGDGGLATNASIQGPYSVIKDASGNIYIAEFGNNRVRRISTSGIISTVAGTGSSTSTGDGGLAVNASIYAPSGLAFDALGNLYITETLGNRVRKITTATGIITTVVGTGVQGYFGDGGLATAARLNRPVGITFSSAGDMYICDGANYRVRKVTTAGIISTYAGNGTVSSTGDGGLATAAAINYPVCLIFDALGNAIISEFNGHKIRKVSTTNIISTIAGTGIQSFSGDGGLATAAYLNNPYGLAFDSDNNLLFADFSNNRVRKINTLGIISTIVGTSSAGYNGDNISPLNASLYNPSMILVDATNSLYISEYSNSRIRKVNPNTVSSTIPTVSATPASVCLGDTATLTVTSGKLNGASTWKWYSNSCGGTLEGSGNAIKVSPKTATTYYVRGEGGCTPTGVTNSCGIVTVGLTGTLPSISISTTSTIVCAATTVNFTANITNGGTSPSYQWKKNGNNVATTPTYSSNTLQNGDIITCVLTSNLTGCLAANNVVSNAITIYFAGAASVTTVAGNGNSVESGDGGSATSASVGYIQILAKDKFGNIYSTAQNSNKIRKTTPAGLISTFAGTGVASSTGDGGQASLATFNNIFGLAVDASGNVYVSEYYGQRIRKISTNGIVSTVVGTGVAGFTGDGGLAVNAQISNPGRISFDKNGNMYFVDYSNLRIRKVNTSGVISTVAGNGSTGYNGDGISATSASLYYPTDITLDTASNLIITDASNLRIRKVNATTGIINTIAGNGSYGFSGDGSLATAAQFQSLNSIAVDGNNNIYVVDASTNRIRMINNSGIINTVLGNGLGGYNGDGLDPLSTTIYNPQDILADSIGVLLIADYSNYRIRKLMPTLGLPIINSLTTSSSTVCSGSPVTLTVTSGTLNAAANWKWYNGTCGGTAIGTGSSIVVNPTNTTTYYARGEGGCITSPATCTPIAVYVTPAITPTINLSASKTSICPGTVDSFRAVVANAGTCFTNWNYRKPILITNNNAADLTDFQVKIVLNTASLVTAGKMLSTGNDIRFSDSICNSLSYNIEDSMNTATTIIWVKVNSVIANSTKTIYLYYGNSSALAASNADSTFMLFDGFSGSSLDASKWTSFVVAPTVSGGQINFTTTSAGESIIRSNAVLTAPYVSEMKVLSSSGNWPNIAQLNQSTFSGVVMFQGGTSATHINAASPGGTTYSSSFSNDLYGGNVGVWSIVWKAQNNYTASWLNNSITKTTTTATPTANLHSSLGLLASGIGSMTVDWFRARKFAAISPVVNTSLVESLNAYTGTYNFTKNGVSVQNTASNLYVSSAISNSDTIACTIGALNSCSSPTSSNKIVVKVIVASTVSKNFFGCTSVIFKGNTYTSSTVVRDTVKSTLGCDSIYNVTNISIGNTATTNNINLFGCTSVTYKTNTYTNSVVVRDTVKAVQGCDSIYNIINITIRGLVATTNTNNIYGCNNIIYNGNTYSSSTVLRDTVKTGQGCDSIYNITNINISSLPSISGRLISPLKAAIKGVTVNVNDSGNITSSVVNGSYTTHCINSGHNVTIKPYKNNDVTKSNGVSSTDVLLVQRHILNTTKLNAAYKIIAADVDGNKLINSVDVLRIKRLILGTDTTFTKTVGTVKTDRLWEFVDSSYSFPDTTNPFPFKDSIGYNNVTIKKTNQTFVGVKLGDVNYDWNASILRGIKPVNLELVYSNENKDNKFDGQIRVSITANNFNNIAALQTTLHFNNDLYDFVKIENGKLAIDYNETRANNTGNVPLLWTDKNADAKSFDKSEILFTIVLKPKQIIGGESSSVDLTLNNEITATEAFEDNNRQPKGISLTRRINSSVVKLNEVVLYPNPAKEVVTIVSKLGIKDIKLFDAVGKQIIITEWIINSDQQRTFKIKSLSKGFYNVQITMPNKEIFNSKLIVE